jgi:hypothetical protein
MRLQWLAPVLVPLSVADPVLAQSPAIPAPGTAVGTAAGSIFVGPDEKRTPLRIAAKGSVLRALGIEGVWFNVQL